MDIFKEVYVTIITRDDVAYPMWLNISLRTLVVGRQYLFHVIPNEPNSPHPDLTAFRCYYPKENLSEDAWIDIGLAARDAGMHCFPMVVLHNEDGLLIFESVGLANKHRYEYPYATDSVSHAGREIPSHLH